VGKVYDINALPALTPPISPVVAAMVTIDGLALVHTPLGVALVSVVVNSTHTVGVPPIGLGIALTVIGAVTKQPVPAVE
jgi:hypothetical protein